jgi:hypothetical protein
MRTLALALILAAAPSFVFAADSDTAYKALRVFGKKFGDSQLNRVVEVRGRSGTPQPQVWKVIGNDPSARGGLLEADIQRGTIVGQRTPTARGPVSSTVLDLNQLNLDSDGAFTVANQEMQKRNAPFDRMDYLLRTPGVGRSPVWHLELFDGSNGRIATFEIAADSGAVLEQNINNPRTGPVARDDFSGDRDYVSNGGNKGRQQGSDPQWSQSGEPFRGVGDFFHRMGKRMERRGSELKRFFAEED